MIYNIDYDAVVTASGNSDALDTCGLGQISFTVEITSLTGTSPTIQVGVQASDDAVNWNVVHDTQRFTDNGSQRLSGVRISARYYRYYWLVGGTSPSCNVKVSTSLKEYSPNRTGSLFRYSDLNLKTLNATSTVFSAFSNTEVSAVIVRPSDGLADTAGLLIQVSNDNLNWGTQSGLLKLGDNSIYVFTYSGNAFRFFRLIVSSPVLSVGSSVAHVFWNSTGGA